MMISLCPGQDLSWKSLAMDINHLPPLVSFASSSSSTCTYLHIHLLLSDRFAVMQGFVGDVQFCTTAKCAGSSVMMQS